VERTDALVRGEVQPTEGSDSPAATTPEQDQALREAEREAREKYPHIAWDFSGAHIDTIGPTLKQFDRLARDFPYVAARLRYVGTVRGAEVLTKPGYQNVPTFVSNTGREIVLNTRFYGAPTRLAQLLADAKASKWLVGDGTIGQLLTHEWGHLLDTYLQGSTGALLAFVADDERGMVRSAIADFKQRYASAPALSRYGETLPREAFAEGLAALYHGSAEVRRKTYTRALRNFLGQIGQPANWYTRGWWRRIRSLPTSQRARVQQEIDALWRELGLQ